MSSCSNAASRSVRASPLGPPGFQKTVALSTRQRAAAGSFLKVKAEREKERKEEGQGWRALGEIKSSIFIQEILLSDET